ncbi:MAG: polysaccharide biosynthesis tyrosine autokinase [Verrucomicrobia bacterium]|nr:polysaccharide biosynthesis tyrosine autokinase [Verrucomicrobiota bacterium]
MKALSHQRSRLPYWLIVRFRLRSVLLIFVLVVLTAAMITLLTPKEYMSFVTIRVEPAVTQVQTSKDTAPTQADDPKFTETQLEIITGKDILYPVIQLLDLQKNWSKNGVTVPLESVYIKLRGMIQPREIGSTNLIQISVYSTDPKEAALIANTVAQEYLSQRASERQAVISKSLKQLRDDVQQKEKAVNDASTEMSRLRNEAGVADSNGDSSDTSARSDDSAVTTNQEKVNEVAAMVAALKRRVDELDRLRSDDILRTKGLLRYVPPLRPLPLILGDPSLEQKLPLYQDALAEKARLLSHGLGSNHPDVQAIQAQIDTTQAELVQEIDSRREGLLAQLTTAENALKSMQASTRASVEANQEKRTANAQYLEAQDRYTQESKLLEVAKGKLTKETIDHTTSQNPDTIRGLAERAVYPSRPNILLNMFLGAIAGLVLALGFAFLLDCLDTRIKTLAEVEKRLGVPVLGVIPKGIRRSVGSDPGDADADAEAYRILKTNTDFARQKVAASVLTVVSGGPGEGRSTTVCNLATVCAAGGRQTLVVDADLRRPAQHQLFKLDNQIGLSDYLTGRVAFDRIIQHGQMPNLFVITTGSSPGSAVAYLSSDRLEKLVETVKEWFDIVIFDCPPILGLSDTSVVSSLAEGAIIVAQHRRFPRSMMVRGQAVLQNLGTKILGVALTEVEVKYDRNFRYFTAYRGYGYENLKEQTTPARAESMVNSPHKIPLPSVTKAKISEHSVKGFQARGERPAFRNDVF